MYKRIYFDKLRSRLSDSKDLIQVILGPRQVGKTTLIRQLVAEMGWTIFYHSADSPVPQSASWIEQKWNEARLKLSKNEQKIFLIFDEIQKIQGWSEAVKKLFDEDKYNGSKLIIVLLGSSKTLIQEGLSESLAGRFEVTLIPHWSFKEIHNAFGTSLNEYIYFGSYPGAMPLIQDQDRWKDYIKNSIIETTISRDLLLTTRVEKPALLRNLFLIGMNLSSQVVSYQKMVGQLQDAGNPTTLAHYLNLLSQIMSLTGIEKYSLNEIRKKKSSPKFIPYNMALKSALSSSSYEEIKNNSEDWGRWMESAVGAELINSAITNRFEVFYWSEAHAEVDFVLTQGKKIVAIEVKSGARKEKHGGLDKFKQQYSHARCYVVGTSGIKIEDFFEMDFNQLF